MKKDHQRALAKRRSAPAEEGAGKSTLFLTVAAALLAFAGVLPAQDDPLVSLDFTVAGQQLNVTPAALAVPKGIPGSILPRVQAGGDDALSGQLAAGAFVEATLRGPSFAARRLVGAPNEPLLLPPLNLVGDYTLDNIRLVDKATGDTILEGNPSSVPVSVFDEVLVARVTSRPLSSAEIQEKGIVIDENNFRAVEFEVGFVVDGETIPVKFPVVAPAFYNRTEIIPQAEVDAALAAAELINDELAIQAELPAKLTATGLDIEIKGLNIQFVDPTVDNDLGLTIPPIAGLVMIPGKIGFLNQFFSVQVFVENAAPIGSGLSVNSVTAELVLPTGADRVPGASYEDPGDDPIRFARVGPDAVISNILPVTQAGADGKSNTDDDVKLLFPGEVGTSEFLVEGLREGLHVMDVLLKGSLEGLVAGAVEVEGQAAGSVLVRNPNFSLAFSHPRTIRSGEPYTAKVTLLNTSLTPANQVSVTLPTASISGAVLESEDTVVLGDILPGETRTAEFRLRAQRTGSITFSNLSTDEDVTGRFRLVTGIDERGVVLSPDSIGYPEFVDDLPPELFAAADRVLGQALSVATAAQLPPAVIRVRRSFIRKRVIELAEAGQRLRYGDMFERVLADLLLDWQGGRQLDAGFDQIVRTTDAGREWREALAMLMDDAQPALTPAGRLAERAPDLAGRGEPWWAIASDSPMIEPGFVNAATVDLDNSGIPQTAAYRASDGGTLFGKPHGTGFLRWCATGAGATTDLSALVLGDMGAGTLTTWSGVTLGTNAKARFDGNGADLNLLEIDANGDGVFETQITGTVAPVTELMPMVIAAVQDVTVVSGRPAPGGRCTASPETPEGKQYNNYGTIVGVLFSKRMNDEGAADAASYVLDDGNGAGSVAIQPGGRVALINLKRGIGTFFSHDLTVMDVQDPRGNALGSETLAVQTNATEGVAIDGKVVRADGTPAAGVPVTLTYYEEIDSLSGCKLIKVRPTQVTTDEKGEFLLDFVLSGPPYSLSATDTAGLGPEAIAIILQSTEDDLANGDKLLELASQPNIANTLLAEFAVGALPDAIALAEGLDRALLKDVIGTASGRIGSTVPVALRFRGRGTVTGTVFAADGVTPVEGAAVNLFPDPASREKGRGILTEGGGEFAFFGVPLGVFSLQVTAPDGTTRSLSEPLEKPGQVLDVPVVLSAAPVARTSLAGRIFEADGVTPHGGGRVFVGKLLGGSLREVVAVGDAAAGDVQGTAGVETGFWTVDGVPEGAWDVVAVSADGRLRGERTGVAAVVGSATTVNVVLQGTAMVSGRVEFADGTPAQNAIVAGGRELVRTDATGAFTIEGVPTGRRTVSAGLERDPPNGIEFPRIGSTSINVVAGNANNFAVIRFAARGSITGRVLDLNGDPVPGVQVALPLGEDSFAYTSADSNGVYLFENLALREWTVSAPAPVTSGTAELLGSALDTVGAAASGEEVSQQDLLQAITDAFTAFTGANDPLLTGEGETFNPDTWGFNKVILNFDGQLANVDIVYLPQGTIAGVVKNGEGVPIGVRVRLTGIGPSRTGDVGFILRGDRNSDPATGEFIFEDQALAGAFGLQAASPFFPVVITYEDATTRVDPDKFGIEMMFPPEEETSGRLIGQVFNPDGTLVGADIDVAISFGDLVIRTDASGMFDTQIELPRGTYTVEAEDPATGLRGRSTVGVVAGVVNETAVTLLEKGDLEITVEQADGTPVPGASVHVMGVNFPYEEFDVVTDGTGNADLANLFEGLYSIRAAFVSGPTTIRGSASATVRIGELATATVMLQPTGTIQGRFVEEDGVTPVPFAQVVIAGGIGFATTDASGAFIIPGLPLGSYRLTANEPVSGKLATANASLNTDGQVLDVLLLVLSSGEVRGKVLNPTRSGFVPGAVVTMRHLGGLAGDRTVTTGPDGSYSFGGSLEGNLRLTARDPVTGITGAVDAMLAAGQAQLTVDIPLAPRGSFTVTVFEPDGVTPADATVSLFGVASGDTDAQGMVQFGNLALRSYTVTAQSRVPGEERSGQRTGVALTSAGPNPELEMTLLGVGSVGGTVFDSDGTTPLLGVTVELRSESGSLGGETRSFITAGDGTYNFDNVSVGTYRLTATSVALGSTFNGSIDAGGEADVVNLTLGPSGTVRGRLLRADGTTPVEGIIVTLLFDPPSGLLGAATDTTDANGDFDMTGIPVGDFDLEAFAIDVRYRSTTRNPFDYT